MVISDYSPQTSASRVLSVNIMIYLVFNQINQINQLIKRSLIKLVDKLKPILISDPILRSPHSLTR